MARQQGLLYVELDGRVTVYNWLWIFLWANCESKESLPTIMQGYNNASTLLYWVQYRTMPYRTMPVS